MKNLEALIKSAVAGDDRAFSEIIRQFKDMAFGYAYSLLGDLHLAEDAAQEAFVEAFVNLKKLKNTSTFPGWFRRIVQFRCSRFSQRKQLPQAPLQEAVTKASSEPGPYALMEKKDMEDAVLSAVNELSQPLREVTTLFYINGYSRKDIADFLEIPVNTVRSRLSTSRDQLKRRLSMNGMIKETFGNKKPGDDFEKKVIENMSKVTYNWDIPTHTEKREVVAGRHISFPACMCSILETLGEDYGTMKIPVKTDDLDLVVRGSNLYSVLMAASGSTFRLNWNAEKFDDYTITDVMRITPDPLESIIRTFDAVGYKFEIFGNKHHPEHHLFGESKDYDFLKEQIIHSIRDKNRPILAFGVFESSCDPCIVSGYDESADILIGMSTYQKHLQSKPGIEFDPSGYFRQRDWFQNTRGIIIIGDKYDKPPVDDTYRSALEYAVRLFHSEETIENKKCGKAAFKAWTDMILNDDYFPVNDTETSTRHGFSLSHSYGDYYESRNYAYYFLIQVMEQKPELKNELKEAHDCYKSISGLCWQIRGLLADKPMEKQPQVLAGREFRESISEMLLKASEREAKAIGIFEDILKKW